MAEQPEPPAGCFFANRSERPHDAPLYQWSFEVAEMDELRLITAGMGLELPPLDMVLCALCTALTREFHLQNPSPAPFTIRQLTP